MIDDKKLYQELGNALKSARQTKGLGQVEVADALKMTRASLYNIEQGKQRASLYVVYTLAELYQRPLAELLPDIEEVSSRGEIGRMELSPSLMDKEDAREQIADFKKSLKEDS